MKKFILALCVSTLGLSVQASELPTKVFEDYIRSWDGCDNRSECGKLSLEINSYVNHPDTQTQIQMCESDAECYEAMNTLATKLITEISKVF